jgi:hypothetical protein
MIVSDVVKDLRAVLDEFPAAATWRVGVATYTDGPGSDIDVMYAASFHTDPDDEFFLVPEGMGEAFALEERPFSAQELLEGLNANPDWAGHVAYVRSGVVELPDGSVASRNMPLWGTGVHQEAQLVYFYCGAPGSEP